VHRSAFRACQADIGVIYGIVRATAKEKATGENHEVTMFKLEE